MDFLLSRQPIYEKSVSVAAYELRSRPIQEDSPDAARTLYPLLTDDALLQIAGQRPVVVGLSYQGLAKGWWKNLNTKAVMAYSEDFVPGSPVAEELKKLADRGARIVLPGTLASETLSLFNGKLYAATVDVRTYTPEKLKDHHFALRQLGLHTLAQGIDTYDDLEYCKGLGFDFYQGHFISRTAANDEQDVPVNRLSMMRALAKLQNPETPLAELEQTVSQDAALSYKLLAYANSAAVALPNKVNSVGHAVRMVGVNLLRRWATVLLLSSVDDKPRELMTIALVRARMCELLSASVKNAQKDSFFSTGLLSVIDALLSCTMEKALARLPLSDDVQAALIRREGPAGEALNCAAAYEKADWDNVRFNGMELGKIRDIYMESIDWARTLTTGLCA